MPAQTSPGIGNRIAPARFLLFTGVALVAIPIGVTLLSWRQGVMAGFDLAALAFLLSCLPLLRDSDAGAMRDAAKRNDANRAGLLAITGAVMAVVLVAVADELAQKDAAQVAVVALIVSTLALAWLFSNTVYALHYAHLFYTADKDGKDCGGLDVPKTQEPDYWDFVYFAFCLGMTFQTADIDMTDGRFRRVATFHCLAAFVFNLGILAFTINVLGS